jgi:hypothetical protein
MAQGSLHNSKKGKNGRRAQSSQPMQPHMPLGMPPMAMPPQPMQPHMPLGMPPMAMPPQPMQPHMLPMAMAQYMPMGMPPMQQFFPPQFPQGFAPYGMIPQMVAPTPAKLYHPSKNTGQQFVQKAVPDDKLRPFAYACKRSFEYLTSKIEASLKHLGDKEYVVVRNLDYKDIIEFTSSDGRPQKWALHTVMYGKMKSAAFTDRENTHSAYGIISPFLAVQCIYREKGFFITNESDPSKGHALVIVIRRAPKADSPLLWHAQNIIPDLSDDLQSVIDNFYRTNFKKAASFVNRRVAAQMQDDADDDQFSVYE